MHLYRPVGQAELDLIVKADYRKYPPRLPDQPIFYPVGNKKSADPGYAGYVTTFEIEDEYISQYDVQTVGASYHQEYWIPAEELENFNHHIIGQIHVI